MPCPCCLLRAGQNVPFETYSVSKGQAEDLSTGGHMCAFRWGASGHSALPKHVRVPAGEGVVIEGTEEIPWGPRKLRSQREGLKRELTTKILRQRGIWAAERSRMCAQDQRSD